MSLETIKASDQQCGHLILMGGSRSPISILIQRGVGVGGGISIHLLIKQFTGGLHLAASNGFDDLPGREPLNVGITRGPFVTCDFIDGVSRDGSWVSSQDYFQDFSLAFR